MTGPPGAASWPNGYRCLCHQRFESGRYAVRSIEWDNLEPIRRWRDGQLDVLRQAEPLTVEDQQRYFADVVGPQLDEARPDQVLVGFLEDDELIGYGGVVHIDWGNQRGEVSFLVAPDQARGPGYVARFSAFLGLLRRVAADLGLRRLTTETFAFRHESIAILEAQGFVREGRLRQHQLEHGEFVDSLVHGLLLDDPDAGGLADPPTFAVLVSSASGKVPLLRAVEDAARRVAPGLTVIAGDVDPEALALRVTDRSWLMPPTDGTSLDELVGGLAAEGIGAVIPTRDGELAFWARHAPDLHARGIAVLVPSPMAVERCLDKLAFADACEAAGLPTIATATSFDADQLGPGPYVVKERFGAGSRSLGLGLDAEAAAAWAERLDDPVFQPLVAGPEISVDTYVTGDGRWMGAVARTRDEVVNGESRVTTTIDDAEAVELARSLAAALDLRGHAVIQAIRGPHGYVLVEANARVGGASTLAYAAGLDSLRWFLLEAAGADPADHPFRSRPAPMRLVRVPTDVIS